MPTFWMRPRGQGMPQPTSSRSAPFTRKPWVQTYSRNPQYHGFLHPEVPGYEKQIQARDNLLARHPRLKVVGCHLGSLEYDVDEIAKRLEYSAAINEHLRIQRID